MTTRWTTTGRTRSPRTATPGQLNDTTEHFRQRRSAAFQAYYENMPLRASSVPAGFDMKIYRTIQWGQLANFHMMDTRQYRDDQLAGDGWKKNVAERLAEDRTITGAEQEKWLLDGFKNSTQRWDILGQQVFFAERDRDQAPDIDDVSMDGWDGYASSRRRITQGWVDANVRNAVVLTGDVHRNWANDLKVDYKDPCLPCGGFRTGVHVHHLHRQRHRLHHRPHHGLEPAPEVLQRQPRLREHPHHEGLHDRRLPGAGLRHHAGRSGQHQEVVHHQRSRPRPGLMSARA